MVILYYCYGIVTVMQYILRIYIYICVWLDRHNITFGDIVVRKVLSQDVVSPCYFCSSMRIVYTALYTGTKLETPTVLPIYWIFRSFISPSPLVRSRFS